MSKTSNALGQLLVVIPLGCATISAPAARPPIDDDLAITCIAASPKGALVAVGESDGSVITIDVGTHDWKEIGHATGRGVGRLAWSASGKRLAAAYFAEPGTKVDADKEDAANRAWPCLALVHALAVWDVPTSKELCRALIPPALANIVFRPDGERLLVYGKPTQAQVFDATTGKLMCTLDPPDRAHLTCAAWIESGAKIVTGDDAGFLRTWNPANGTLSRSVSWVAKEIRCLCASRNGERVIAGGDRVYVGAWRAADLVPIWMHTQHDWGMGLDDDNIVDVDAVDGHVISAGNEWGSLECWTREGDRVWSFDFGGGNPVRLFARFDPDGARVATYGLGMPNSARVFDMHDGKVLTDLRELYVLQGEGSLNWTADGRFLVACSSFPTSLLVLMDGRTFERICVWSPIDPSRGTESAH